MNGPVFLNPMRHQSALWRHTRGENVLSSMMHGYVVCASLKKHEILNPPFIVKTLCSALSVERNLVLLWKWAIAHYCVDTNMFQTWARIKQLQYHLVILHGDQVKCCMEHSYLMINLSSWEVLYEIENFRILLLMTDAQVPAYTTWKPSEFLSCV